MSGPVSTLSQPRRDLGLTVGQVEQGGDLADAVGTASPTHTEHHEE